MVTFNPNSINVITKWIKMWRGFIMIVIWCVVVLVAFTPVVVVYYSYHERPKPEVAIVQPDTRILIMGQLLKMDNDTYILHSHVGEFVIEGDNDEMTSFLNMFVNRNVELSGKLTDNETSYLNHSIHRYIVTVKMGDIGRVTFSRKP